MELFVYVVGIEPARSISLGPGVLLEKASCNPTGDDIINATINHGGRSEYDLGVAAISLRGTKAQLRVSDGGLGDIEARVWNSQWLCVLLSAICETRVSYYFECDKPLESVAASENLRLMHNHLLPIPPDCKYLGNSECNEIEQLFSLAAPLMKDKRFSFAVNCYWGHGFHPRPTMQMATVWTGIEMLFPFKYKKRKKLSERIPGYLDGFVTKQEIEHLWDARCEAVHEGFLSDIDALSRSAALLARCIKKCIANGRLPDIALKGGSSSSHT